MHELSITQSIVEDIAEKLGDARVTKVTLEIGRLSGIVVDSIRFCFDLVAESTTLQGARLIVHEPTGQVTCPFCRIQFETTDPIVLCPDCGTSEVTVLAGRELRIKSVEVVTCAAPAAAPQK